MAGTAARTVPALPPALPCAAAAPTPFSPFAHSRARTTHCAPNTHARTQATSSLGPHARTPPPRTQRMSGIATSTAQMVSALDGLPTKVLETRKTAPGLRVLDKWAVLIGGWGGVGCGVEGAAPGSRGLGYRV